MDLNNRKMKNYPPSPKEKYKIKRLGMLRFHLIINVFDKYSQYITEIYKC